MRKRKTILRLITATGLVVLVLAALAFAIVRSAAFHRYVLAKIVEKASAATGGRVEISDFQVHWSRLGVDLDHIVLHGSESAARPPLLEVDHLLVGLKIISLWSRKINLNEIVVDHPSIHFTVDTNGRTNLPHPPSAGGSGASTSIFDLAIGRFVVNRGELVYNDRRVPLEGEVQDLQAKVDLNTFKTEYNGELGYRDGRLQIGSFDPIVHSLQVQFGATPAGLTINALDLRSGSSSASLQGRIQDYANPLIDGTYHGDIFTRDLGQILKISSMPVGQVSVKGTVRYQNRENRPGLDNLATEGDFRSATVALNFPPAHANIRGVTGKFNLHDGTLEVKNVNGALLGGNASGSLTMTHLDDQPMAKVAAELRGISLGAASAALNSQALQRTAISGDLNGKLDGSWEGAGNKFRMHADATIAAATGSSTGAGVQAGSIPLQGDLHVTYDNPTETLTLRASKLQAPHTSITLDGTAGKQSSLALQMQSDDLREVDRLALIAWRAFASGSNPQSAPIEPLGLGGSGSFIGQLHGSAGEFQLEGQLSSNHFQYHDATLNLLEASLAVGPSHIRVSQARLRPAEGGQIDFDGAADLTDWAFKPQNSMQIDLNASSVPVGVIERAANLHYPVSGTLAGTASLQGTLSGMKGQGTVALTQGIAREQPFQNLNAQFQVNGVALHASLQLSTPAGAGSGEVSYDYSSQAYDAQLSLPNLQVEKLQAIQKREFPISGALNASVQGKGTLKQPQLTATIDAPNLTIGRQSLNGLQLRVGVANQRASIVVESTASGASIKGNGTVTLHGNYPIEASLDMKNISLGAELGDFDTQIPPEVSGQAQLHATLRGPLRERNLLEGEITVPKLNLNYATLQIGNVAPIHAVYRGGVVSLDQCELKGTGTDLQLRAALPLGREQNLQALANGDVDLQLIQLFASRWNGSGQVHLEMNASGTRAHPDVNGTIRLVKAAFQSPDSPIGAENVNGVIALKNGRVEIQSFKGEAGGGTVTAQGFATYQPGVQYNVSLVAKSVRLRYPVGTRTILDGNLMLTGTKDSGILSGQLLVDRLSLTKDFDLSTFADQFGTISTPSSGPSLARNIKVNVSLKSAREMALASSKLSVQGSVDLMVRGTAAEPVLLGRTDITGGEIFFGGNRYTVESGVVQFVNPVRTEPVVNILVTTTVDQFNLSMNFVGPLDRLRTTYTSDPPLAPVDIINLIATGQPTEAASTGQTSPESVIAGQLTSQFSSRVEKLAGVSSLTIDPQVGGAQGNGGGRLVVQQRVTKNLYFTFSTDLTTSTGQIVQVEYQVSKRYALSTTRDQNGGYTLQVKIHKRF
jgi:translocation and assembly module TamB